jgi:hypothetical protein
MDENAHCFVVKNCAVPLLFNAAKYILKLGLLVDVLLSVWSKTPFLKNLAVVDDILLPIKNEELGEIVLIAVSIELIPQNA